MFKSLGVFICLLPALIFAQNEVDALRYSQLGFGGTARFNSMAGAFGALGGDPSTLSYNPAGIGIYRKSEFNFTPSLFTQNISSVYNGTGSSDLKSKFNFSNIALIATKFREKNDEKNEGWVTTSLGFAYSRTNTFAGRASILGSSTYSLLNNFVKNAKNFSPNELDPFAEQLAYNVYLIDDTVGNYNYFSQLPAGTFVNQKKSIETSGGMGEFAVSYGGNYSNKLYIGGTLGFPHIKYNESSVFSEADEKDSIPLFRFYDYETNLSTTGSGINLKLGLIYRLRDWMRVGGAIHTPTYYGLKDSYNSRMTAVYQDSILYTESLPGVFNYSLRTPMRAIASAGFIIHKKGLVGIDYEYLNYSTANLSSSPNVFSEQNTAIKAKYTSASNVRVGGELRMDPFSVRLGYAFYGNPYAAGVGNKTQKNSLTFGAGVKGDGFYADLAYTMTYYSDKYYLYEGTDPASNKYRSSGILITVGFKY